MGFFDKVKGALNIGGSKITINGPGSVANGSNLDFTAMLVGGKMEQEIASVEAKVVLIQPKQTIGIKVNNGTQAQQMEEIVLAQDSQTTPFTVQPAEQKEFSFSLPVKLPGPDADQGGFMGTLGKLNNMAMKNKRRFELRVRADIKGSTDATAKMDLLVQ